MSKNQFNLVTTLLSLVLLLIGCSSKDPERFYSSKDDFSMKFPKEWDNREGYEGLSVVSLSPFENSADEFHEEVEVSVEQLPAMELDEYFVAYIDKFKQVPPDFQENDRGIAYLGDTEAKWFTYTARVLSLPVKAKKYITVHDKRAYVITCTATTDNFDRYKGAFDAIAQSIEFE